MMCFVVCLLFGAVHAYVNRDKVCFTSQHLFYFIFFDVVNLRSQQQMEELQ